MAISLTIDEATHEQLKAKAERQGLTVSEYLAMLARAEPDAQTRNELASTLDFEAELKTLVFSGPTLPADFSRADIYADHD